MYKKFTDSEGRLGPSGNALETRAAFRMKKEIR
jgi:hypothetical protein